MDEAVPRAVETVMAGERRRAVAMGTGGMGTGGMGTSRTTGRTDTGETTGDPMIDPATASESRATRHGATTASNAIVASNAMA